MEAQDCCETVGMEQTYDLSEDGSLTTVLAESIAEYKGTDPLNSDFSLYESVDTEALDELFASASGTDLRTEFDVAGVTVCTCKTESDEIVVTMRDANA